MRHNTLSTLKSLVATAMIALFTLSAAAQDTGSAYSRLGYGPVSYTHLTLPTNREV